MKILLVQPPKAPLTMAGDDIHIFEPLALEYLASAVGHDHDVKVLDMRFDKNFEDILSGYQPDVVGITAYTAHVNVVKRLFNDVKRWNSKALTVVGGHHATVMPQDFLMPSIDLIVLGEGVFPFREIVRRFEKKESFDGIERTVNVKGNRMIPGKCDGPIDLDSFPFPDRKSTTAYRKKYYSEWLKPLASIRTSKGCPYRCSFCAEWQIAGGYYHKRKPERIAEELSEIEEECVFFADDESLVDTARMLRLARLIREMGIRKRYFIYGRSDTICRNHELLAAWKEIGLERIFIGLEFFRNEDLNYIRKNSFIEDNASAIRLLQELGIDIYASFIIRPEFVRSDFAALREYCLSMQLDYPTFAVLTPLPGTDLYEETREKLITDNYDYYDLIHTILPTKLPLKEFYEEYYNLMMSVLSGKTKFNLLTKFRFWEIPGVIRRGYRLFKRLKKIHLDYAQ